MNTEQEPEPKIIVDDDWKSQARAEKEKLQDELEQPPGSEEEFEMPPASFPVLIATLSSQAMASLGFLPDPATGKPVVRPSVARHFIDMLALVEEKTRGNLTPEESTMLNEQLHQLRMAFVHVTEGPSDAPPQDDAGSGSSSTIELP